MRIARQASGESVLASAITAWARAASAMASAVAVVASNGIALGGIVSAWANCAANAGRRLGSLAAREKMICP